MRGRPTATQQSVLSQNMSLCKMDQSMAQDDLNVSAVMMTNEIDESHYRSQQNGSSFTKAMNNFDAKNYNYGDTIKNKSSKSLKGQISMSEIPSSEPEQRLS